MTASARVPRVAVRFASWAALGLGAGLVTALVLPVLVGYRTLAVMSGSMEPTLSTGDIIVTRRIVPLAARVGDIVTFKDPTRGGRLVTHRVRRLQVDGEVVQLETKGDANNTEERWSISTRGQIGRVVYRMPRFGYLVRAVASPPYRLVLVCVPTMIIGAWALLRIWRSENVAGNAANGRPGTPPEPRSRDSAPSGA